MSTKEILQEFIQKAIEQLPPHLRVGQEAILIFTALGFVPSPVGRQKIVLGIRPDGELPTSEERGWRLSLKQFVDCFFGGLPIEGKLHGEGGTRYALNFGKTKQDIFLLPIRIDDVVHWGAVVAEKKAQEVCEYFCNNYGATGVSYHLRALTSSDHVDTLLVNMKRFVGATTVGDLLPLIGTDRRSLSNDSPVGLAVTVSKSTDTTDAISLEPAAASERAPEEASTEDKKLSAAKLRWLNAATADSESDDDEDFIIDGIDDRVKRPPMPTQFPNRKRLVADLRRVDSDIEVLTRAATFVDQALYFIHGPQSKDWLLCEKIQLFKQHPKCRTPVKKGLNKVLKWRNNLDYNSREQLPEGIKSFNMTKRGFLHVFDCVADSLHMVYQNKGETQADEERIAELERALESTQSDLESAKSDLESSQSETESLQEEVDLYR